MVWFGIFFVFFVFFFFVCTKFVTPWYSCLKYENCKNQKRANLKLKSQKFLPYTVDVSHGFQGSTKEMQVDFLPNSPKGKTLVCSQSQKASMKFGTCNVKAFFSQIICTLLNKTARGLSQHLPSRLWPFTSPCWPWALHSSFFLTQSNNIVFPPAGHGGG